MRSMYDKMRRRQSKMAVNLVMTSDELSSKTLPYWYFIPNFGGIGNKKLQQFWKTWQQLKHLLKNYIRSHELLVSHEMFIQDLNVVRLYSAFRKDIFQ